ncbi:MAG: M1 family metallopeptidase [Elusimicrobia bacterium]|nr:M1 family metallopeptidase [Elusimicrobiota bacterium]MDE2237537.1 M1 family metallopeptidase [Elusimicrobiota bacterium]MDE2425272.1 M1 family metallopeptidase [Elusimicrobiota bacterium]
MACPDPHSCFDDSQSRARHWRLRLRVDFERKVLSGEAELRFERPAQGPLDLDTKGLTILSASCREADVPFELEGERPILGRRLRLRLPPGTRSVAIRYETSPEAMGLQWLSAAQTEGKRKPFLFSQCQAIHARSVLPCQDSPSARVTFEAELDVPEGLSAVMGAGPLGDAPSGPGRRAWRFGMPQPIPSYLFALAVGELSSRELSSRCRVWAEPACVDKAAWEFAGVESMLAAAESLFGPYEWQRYDMLVLPPSFPYGGMENPRMTFLTPTLLAGDRSLVDVVAHELAHSWTGNLVTNATAEHFWLNEGFTVWAERRILKALRGEEAASLAWAIGQKALDEELKRFKDRPELTRLRAHLEGVDPDDAYSAVPYEKGARFLACLERAAGQAEFDAFVKSYLARYRFQSVATEDFCRRVEERFPGLLAKVDADAWLNKPGMPSDAPRFCSPRLNALAALAEDWPKGRRPDPALLRAAKPEELLVFLQRLPQTLGPADCRWLDDNLGLTGRGNYEVLVQWLRLAAASGYQPAFERVRRLLLEVGRMKYVRPLYLALGKTPPGRALARRVFSEAAGSYHVLTRRAAESALAGYPA